MTRPVSAVLFDMDGVLCFSEPFILEASMRMLKERHGLDVEPHEFKPFVGAGEARFAGGVAEAHGVTLDLPADKDRIYEIYFELIPGRLEPVHGAPEFVRACRAAGLKVAVASSADRIKVDANLDELGLPPASFDAIVSGSDIHHKKPDPEIFLLASARVGLDPSRCLVVEDAKTGIRAGLAAGCPCLGITTSFPAEELLAAGARWAAADFDSIPAGVPLPGTLRGGHDVAKAGDA